LPPGKDGELRERIGNILCAPISVRFFPPGWKPRLYVRQGCLTPQLCFGVRVKKLQARDDVWSVRISDQHRAVGVRRGDTIEWIWIGTHNEFDNLFA
jgi:hypothetical protein